jgi:glutamate synthase domain-containing protein 3
MIELHLQHTGSTVAANVLENWETIVPEQFVKVMPVDYKRVLLERQQHEEEEDTTVHEEMASR